MVPLDDGPTRAHSRVGEVRFRGAPSPFGPSRVTVAQPGDLRAGGATPVYASRGVHAEGTAPFAAYGAAAHASATPDGMHWRGGHSVLLKIARSTSGQIGSLAPQRILNTILVLFGYSPRDLDTREHSRRGSVRWQKNMLFATATWMLLLLTLFVDGAIAEQKLTVSDAASSTLIFNFGYSVSVSGDYAVVGAPTIVPWLDHLNDAGSAYIFFRSGTTWTQQQKLTVSDAFVASGDASDPLRDYFGWRVSVSGDYVVVGAYRANNDAGSAYVFVRSGTTWTQQQKLTALDAAPGDYFGYSVSISGDYVVVGAHGANNFGADDVGSAYVFVRSGTTWTQQQKLTASDAASGDSFAYSVSVSGDYVVVGAHGANNYAGSAYVFVRSGTTWTQQHKLTASDAGSYDHFGRSVSVSGGYAVVGAYGNDDAGSNSAHMGSAYIIAINFVSTKPSSGNWWVKTEDR